MMDTETKRGAPAWAARAAVTVALGVACLIGAGALAPAQPAYADDASLAGAQVDVQAQSVDTQADDYDISWYEGKSSPYEIANVRQLKGLAYLVNSGTDTFKGKVVELKPNTQLIFSNTAIDPIGSVEHPFQGTFDGARPISSPSASDTRIQNLTVNVGDRLSYVGLFGYADESAVIKNLMVTGGTNNPVTVTNSADGKTITRVGAIAGYLGGSIENCWSSVEISITNNGKVPDKAGTTAEELCTITYIGGLVGWLGGNMTDCTRAGDAELRVASTADITEGVPYIAGFVGGIAGYQGDESKPELVPEARGCANNAPITLAVNGKGGVDRFGQQMYSKSSMVGGIVGYAMGNVSECSNTATIQTGIAKDGKNEAGWGASTVGGIVGSLRGPTIAEAASAIGVVGSDDTDPGYKVWTDSKGTKKAETLTVERCSNTGQLVGLTSVAGICGSAGAFTQIEGCSNTAEVIGTRWNKPCPAGIVGITKGNVAYCYNTGRIVTLTGGGYYASGIAALLTTYNNSTTAANLVLDAPEIYGCYITGNIVSSDAGYRAAVIAGENDGYIHDNCYLSNLVADKHVPDEWASILEAISDAGAIEAGREGDVGQLISRINALDNTSFAMRANGSGGFNLVEGASGSKGAKESLTSHCTRSQIVDKDQNRGSVANNHELTAAELRTSFGIAYLNRVAGTAGEWSLCYVSNPNSTGFPLLNWQRTSAIATTDLATATGLSASLAEGGNPSYSAAHNPIPALAVSLNGRQLYQNADYRVIPDEGARKVGTGYVARIEGIDRYVGQPAVTVDYAIDKCDISRCKVSAATAYFNWKRQKPAWVKVVDDAGNEVSADEYEWTTMANSDGSPKAVNGKFYDYVNVHNASYRYDIKVTAKPTSQHFTGETVQPAFHISWATLYYNPNDSSEGRDPTAQYDKIVWGDQSWDFKDALNTKGFVKITYTGKPIEPVIANPTYLGQPLRDGTNKDYASNPLDYDFKYIYGNPNPESLASVGKDCVDVTGSDETKLACMTIRFTPSGNFDNYENVFFEIVPANVAKDVAISGVDAMYAYTGKSIAPEPVLTYNGMTLVKGRDYTVSYKNNKDLGKASVVITGQGNYAGTATKTFTIAKKNTLAVKAKKAVTVRASALAKKAQNIKCNKLMTVTKPIGKVTYTRVSVSKKKYAKNFTVAKSSGQLSVKKGTPKGNYKITIQVTAAGSKGYAAAAKNVTVQVKIK